MNSYLTKIHNVHDELVVVWEKPDDKELVRITLNGLYQGVEDLHSRDH